MRALVFSGGRLGEWAVSYIKEDDLIIGVDAGAAFLAKRKVRFQSALGDFDSVTLEEIELVKKYASEFQSCDPVMKDLTDTEMGMRTVLEKGASEILILGGLGTRFDHSLANVHLLRTALAHQVRCKIIDSYNQIQLTKDELMITTDGYPYVSLLPLTHTVKGVTLEGFQYPLHNASLEMGMSLGISNVLNAKQGKISVKEGELLVIQSRDTEQGIER
ncbi:thiamine diphosphokinase [Bacillus tianshenii]|nr:thiamine diphosphokinase [Bacillus tianshenii]